MVDENFQNIYRKIDKYVDKRQNDKHTYREIKIDRYIDR